MKNLKIKDIIEQKSFVFSLEIFPPKPDSDISVIYDTLNKMKELKPDFISVTYGAGGGTRERTVQLADKIENTYGLTSMAHLTCVGATKESIGGILDELESCGVENIMALRGDLPEGGRENLKDFKYASDLVDFIKKGRWKFCVGVAGYPEKHPEAKSPEKDIESLKKKTDAGADFITTQLFLDNGYFFRYVEAVEKAGIKVPVLPGIMTATNPVNVERMAAMCGVEIPERFREAASKCRIEDAVCEGTVDYTVAQINHLIKKGVKGIHLYTMNKAEQNRRIYEESDIKKARK